MCTSSHECDAEEDTTHQTIEGVAHMGSAAPYSNIRSGPVVSTRGPLHGRESKGGPDSGPTVRQ